jgi:phosphoenolpyruvate-protein kinase (PTS system EI component)
VDKLAEGVGRIAAAFYPREVFSIGSNDLTQLALGLDRDSELVAHLFDERDPTVRWLIAEVIRRAHACHRPVGICGQAPSDYPEMVRFLVAAGIDSISLNPDAVLRTLPEIELRLGSRVNGIWGLRPPFAGPPPLSRWAAVGPAREP